MNAFLGPCFIALAIIFGGSSQAIWSSFLLQLVGLTIIAFSIKRRFTPGRRNNSFPFLLILAVGLGWGWLQIVPLAPSVWQSLPGREVLNEAFENWGVATPSLPISFAADRSIGSMLAIIPLLAAYMAAGDGSSARAKDYSLVIFATALVSILLGVTQLVSGMGYFYSTTNAGAATGTFANSNHMGTLLVIALPFVCAYFANRGLRLGYSGRCGMMLSALVVCLVVLVLGIWVNGSLSMLLLAPPTLIASLLILALNGTVRTGRLALLCLGLGLVGLVGSLLWALHLDPSFSESALGIRMGIWSNTLSLIQQFGWPGTGMGTFPLVYPLSEDPALVDRFYVNHAHSDYLELVLELGLVGAVLIAAFLTFWCRLAVRIWRASEPSYFARAGTVASGVLLLHSTIDYPLRTDAHMAIFGMCMALMCSWNEKFSARAAGKTEAKHLGLSDLR